MIFALERAANELRDDIHRYNITVDPDLDLVSWNDRVSILKPYTSKADCKKAIRIYIKLAKEAVNAKNLESQERLF